MSVSIQYNGQIIASGQPVPFVRREEEMIRYGERWANRTTLTLQGTLTGLDYTSLLAAQSGLISNFSQDFQELQIVQDGEIIFDNTSVWIRSITFPETNYVVLLPYSVVIDCFDSGFFSGYFGVLDPVDEWSFDQQADGRVRMTHNVSARGFNTSVGAFDNARNFVLGRTGWSGQISPAFITGIPPSPCLQSFGEKLNRFEGNYSITEDYLYDPYSSGCVFFRYSTEYDCDTLEGRTSVAVRGELQGGLSQTINDVRTRYSGINIFAIAQSADVSNSIGNQFISRGITEDQASRKISFDILYDNIPVNASGVFFDYSTQIETNDDGITRASLNGNIKGRGDLGTRWGYVQAYYSGLNLFPLISGAYTDASQSTIPLNPTILSSGVSFNQFSAEIGVNAVYDNRPTPSGSSFSELDMNYGFSNGVQKVGAIPLLINDCGKSYYLVDLGYASRSAFSVEGTAKPLCGLTAVGTLPALKTLVDAIAAQEITGNRMVLTKHDFTTSSLAEGELIKFACAWSFEGSAVTSPTGYSQLAFLGLE